MAVDGICQSVNPLVSVANTGSWIEASTVVVQVTKYYTFGGQRIAVRVGGVVYWLHGDHLGSATLTTDLNGNRVGELRYTPYGVTRYEWGSTPTNRRYTGQRWEGALGLYDYRARYYDPALGRFVQADTLVPNPGTPQDLNRYAYVRNNPLRYMDPNGRFAIVPVLIVAGILVLKAVDYGWTAYDLYQSGRVLSDPNAGRSEKLMAGLNVALAVAFEAAEPDDALPVSVPLDDIGRRALMAGAQEALEEGGEEALEQFLRRNLGDDVAKAVLREAGENAAARGQWHHMLSERIMRGLNRYPTLRGRFERDDLVVRALDEASHRGYQRWHRAYDKEVVKWLQEHSKATPAEFLDFLRGIYAQPEMRQRFPDAINRIDDLVRRFVR